VNNQDKENKKKTETEIKIDYDNIDVADIMAQIKAKIAVMPKKPPEGILPPQDFASPLIPPPDMPPVGEGGRSKIKGFLLKIMKPFAPLIKLLILPVHHELTETIKTLDLTNRKLDYWTEKIDRDLYRVNETLNARVEDVNSTINKRLDLAYDDIGRIKEYTKLLHSLSHNLVVELTKLKVEEESLKLKSRILEKDFEFLGKRERALEDQVFK
jgi:hypothetical protein